MPVDSAVAAPSNVDLLLRRLRDVLHKPFTSLTHYQSITAFATPAFFFARIGPPLGGVTRKLEHYSVHRITGDGRCMFRALVRGMANNKGLNLSKWQETEDADELRMAVKESICDSEKERRNYEEALIAITVDEPLKRYCDRIQRSDFWGGESELLVLSKLCRQPILVYIPEHEHTRGGWGSGFIPIAEYGTEFSKAKKSNNSKKPVRLLYSGKNHYDLLI